MQMQSDFIGEARRQAEICNACRYCEGYCSVFPALHSLRTFSDGDITQLANLCHNCRGCYYACQYTAPHEFDLNLPGALAEVRQESWKQHAWPAGFARLFDRSGVAMAVLMTVGGSPSIYAGDEQAFRGVKEHRHGGDDAIRPEFPPQPSELAPEGWPTYQPKGRPKGQPRG